MITRCLMLLPAILLCAGVAAGCSSELTDTDVTEDISVLDQINGDVTDIAEDTVDDTTVIDTGTDVTTQDPGMDSVRDTVEDNGTDLPADTTDPDVHPNECETDYDCDNCDTCIEHMGYRQCVMTPDAGMAQCYGNDDCEDGQVCHSAIVGKPECGGYCAGGAEYDMHEWGVNIVTVTGQATMSTGPERFYGAVAAKPVIYIYSDNPDETFTLDLRVSYNGGTAAETWPEIPLSGNVVWEGVQVGGTDCITTPTPEPDMSGMAENPPSLEIYELDSWVVDEATCLTFGETISRVLFYTGPFSDYQPGLDGTMNVDSVAKTASVDITNNLDVDVGPVIALYRLPESNCMDPSWCPVYSAKIAYAVITNIEASSSANYAMVYEEYSVEATEEEPYPSVDGLLPAEWNNLPDTLRAELLTKGLTENEVGVFMPTWTQTMFGLLGQDAGWYYPTYKNGSFLIYLWPDSRTEEMLPMTAVPEPTESVRAMVEYQNIPTVTPQD